METVPRFPVTLMTPVKIRLPPELPAFGRKGCLFWWPQKIIPGPSCPFLEPDGGEPPSFGYGCSFWLPFKATKTKEVPTSKTEPKDPAAPSFSPRILSALPLRLRNRGPERWHAAPHTFSPQAPQANSGKESPQAQGFPARPKTSTCRLRLAAKPTRQRERPTPETFRVRSLSQSESKRKHRKLSRCSKRSANRVDAEKRMRKKWQAKNGARETGRERERPKASAFEA